MGFIRKLLRCLLGDDARGALELVSLGDQVIRGPIGQALPGAAEVAVIDARTGEPRPGADLLITNLDGVRINGRADEELHLTSDASGQISLDISLSDSVGALAVDASDNMGEPLLFEARGEGVTDSIYIETATAAVAGGPPIQGRIHASDFLGTPVPGGAFDVTAVLDDDAIESVDAQEVGDGVYTFTLSTRRAGTWRLHVTDLDTSVVATAVLCVSPGPAQRFRTIGATDPRAAQPFGRTTLRLRLEDAFGNPLSAGRIVAMDASGAEQPLTLRDGDEAELTVRLPGFGSTAISLRDRESDVASDLTVPFAAAWLQDPGLVQLESRYSTPVHLAPPADRGIRRATIRIAFDGERAAFNSFNGAAEGLETRVEAGDKAIAVHVASAEDLTGEAFPDGLLIGTVEWSCLAAGETCFTVTAAMSPEEPPWELCVDQKEALSSCICVNIIHPPFGKGRLRKVTRQAQALPKIVSSPENVALCCPVLEVRVEDCEISRREWKRIRKPRRRGGGGLPRLGPNRDRDLGRLFDLVADCRKASCINIVLFPISDDAGYDGIMFKRGDKQGFGAIALRDRIKNRLTQHEIGHALGLDHVEDKKNLMWEGRSNTSRDVGVELTADQCRTIFQNLSRYPCD